MDLKSSLSDVFVRGGFLPSPMVQTPLKSDTAVKQRVKKPEFARCSSAFHDGYHPSQPKLSSSISPTILWSELKSRKSKQRVEIILQRKLDDESQKLSEEILWPRWRFKKSRQSEERQITRKIVALGKKERLDEILSMLAELNENGKKVNTIMMNAALTAFVNCHDVDTALQLYNESMVGPNGCGGDGITYGILLKGLGQARRLDDAFELIEAIEDGKIHGVTLSQVHVLTLVNACAEAGETPRARALISRYRKVKLGNAVHCTLTYNMLIKGYARSDNPMEALKLVEEMKLLNLRLERCTYNLLILACVRGKDTEAAMDFLEEMKSECRRRNNVDLGPDVVTYTTLLKGLAEDKDMAGIQSLVEEMKQCPTCTLDRVAYSAIIDACLQAGSLPVALEFHSEMEVLAKACPALRPRAHAFLSLMRAMAEMGDVEGARGLADRMVADASGHVWKEEQMEAHELVMEAAVNSGNLKLANERMDMMTKAASGRPTFSDRGRKALIRLLAAMDFIGNPFQPALFKEEVSPWSPVDSVMITVEQMRPARPWQPLDEVLDRLASEKVLPVCVEDGTCVGVLHALDCSQLMAVTVAEAMGPPPPSVCGSTLLLDVAETMIRTKVALMPVIEEDVNSFMKKRLFPIAMSLQTHSEGKDTIIGFVTMYQLFHAL